MGTVKAVLDTTQYVKVNSVKPGSFIIQSHRDTVRIAFSDVKPARSNIAFHELGGAGKESILNTGNIETDVWMLAMTDSSSVTITDNSSVLISVDEFGASVSTNDNSQLNVSPYIIDEFGNYAHILGDNIFKGSIIAIPPEHHEIHCGDSYEMSHVVELSSGGVLDILVVVPNEGLNEVNPGDDQDAKQYHFKGSISVEAEATIEFFEDVTVSSNGTAIPVFCRNRNTSLDDLLEMYEAPTVTSTGLRLVVAKAGSGKSTGGVVGREDEFILKDNTLYIMRVTNNVTTTEWVSVGVNYYVHPGA